jgi:PTH1 family peptidyl-tRNA hydrolase
LSRPRFVVGVGNPGPEYAGTRHNAGFEILDRTAALLALPWRAFGGGHRADGRAAATPFVLLKPGDYVNRTGVACRRLRDEFGDAFEPARLLLVVDDMALPPGRLRLREGGGAGGHNGLRSVIAELETEEFPRLRSGIGGVPAAAWREHVLAPPSAEEKPLLDRAYARAADVLRGFLYGESLESLAAIANRALPREPGPATDGDGGGDVRRPAPPDRGARGDGSSLGGETSSE